MAQVGTTFCAGDFNTEHAEGHIFVLGDTFFLYRNVKTRPTAARVKFCLTFEECFSTTSTAVCPLIVAVPIFAGKSPFGAFLTANFVLLWGELFSPIYILDILDLVFVFFVFLSLVAHFESLFRIPFWTFGFHTSRLTMHHYGPARPDLLPLTFPPIGLLLERRSQAGRPLPERCRT